ncbi:MAG: M48 family metallopeptidase, partial [Leptonema sp. (in: Bacteria)]|nr:M48 family metallopeptidase [Leptonema sp. (in: bacteria)]
NNFYKQETLTRMLPIIAKLENQTKLKVKKVGVTFARTRWGSCASSGSINFSYRLAQTDPFVQHYLAVHEMAHLVHQNHSADFWAQVSKWMPNYKEAELWLKQHRLQLKV